ncbi:hypothetical protein Deipe_3599 [Deinococcus peraridilitoris DSM 19664]|uniref:Uncharacterized protein n=2 Tax=Deinococcus TaxID=1298 RepID=L0A764_DEIPD|nr:hypothetical protein Deipe_3599 [Deinococcus peraridilitoris DSM 19664]
MASLALPPFLAGLAAFCARRPHGIEQACGHVLRVALPLAALLWAVSGMNGALAFPVAQQELEWWAMGLGGVMLLAGWSAYQAEPQPRELGSVYGLLGGLLAFGVAFATWKATGFVDPSWLRLALASGASALLAVCLRPFVAPASLAAGLVALAFILLDLRKWL